MTRTPVRPFRSRDWFAAPGPQRHDRALSRAVHELRHHAGRAALRQADHRHRPDRAATSSPCNRIHLELAKRVRDGIRDAGGIPMEFPVHPIFENCRRPTAALDRNLLYLGLVEILNGYPIDAVVLTTGCDKTTPAGDHGRLDGRHPGHRAVGRADARRLARRRAGRLGHGDLAQPPQAGGGRDRRGGVPPPRHRSARPRPAIATRWAPPRR